MTPRTKRGVPRGRLDLRQAWVEERDRAIASQSHQFHHRGGHGWMLEAGLDEVLAPLLYGDEFGADAFYRFSSLGSEAASELLRILPPDYLATERQNDGPTIGTVLRAVAAHPDDLRAHGYVIGPGRCDERITVEGVLVRTAQEYTLCPLYGPQLSRCDCEELARTLAEDFGVDDALRRPDELDRWFGYEWGPDGYEGANWYRAWWD